MEGKREEKGKMERRDEGKEGERGDEGKEEGRERRRDSFKAATENSSVARQLGFTATHR